MKYLFRHKYVTAMALLLAASAPAEAQQAVADKNDFIRQDATVSLGFLSCYRQDGRYYLEVPDSVIGRDILVTITISKGASRKERKDDERFGYGGDSMFNKMIRFTKQDGKLYIVYPEVFYQAAGYSNTAPMSSRRAPIHYAAAIVSSGRLSSVIDITDLLMSDDELFSLRGSANDLHLGAAQSEYTEIERIDAFPENINFLSHRSYTLARPVKGEDPDSRWEVSSSWFLLPKVPMKPRIADTRVGFFTYGMPGLSTSPDKFQMGAMAARWRLEPRDEDRDKYLKGELVEPKKPIVYYISHTVPDYLRPYFIKAVNNWAPAFEKAGFKNAIHAEMAPEDSLYNEGDVRYPLVSYKASPIPNAYGPLVVDPRSGEIITSHIGIYHSVLDLVQRWYFVMCAQVDPRAREYPLDKKVIGKLMETVLTHEVGHTLGLRHNFIASTIYPVDSLRNEAFYGQHGLGGSIMDYQRFNYIPQPSDKVTDYDNLLPRIGDYDRFAIEWGYRWDDTDNLKGNTERRRRWVTEKRAKYKWAKYIEESTLGDPRVQSEDSGDDDIQADIYGMKNLKYIMSHLEEWTATKDSDWYPLRRRYLSVQNQYWNYIGHVIRYVAGVMNDKCDGDEKLFVNEAVAHKDQLRALEFLNEYLIKDQKWLWRPDLMAKTGVDWSYDLDRARNQLVVIFLKFGSLTSHDSKLTNLSVDELLNWVYESVYGQYAYDRKLSIHERSLQRNFLADLSVNAENASTFGTGIGEKLKQMLEKIKARALRALASAPDDITRAHYQTIANFITVWQTGDNRALRNN